VERRVDLDGVGHDGARLRGRRAELLGESRASVQGDGHQQSVVAALARPRFDRRRRRISLRSYGRKQDGWLKQLDRADTRAVSMRLRAP
jgi:hypothetical protein